MKNLGNVMILGDSYSTFEGHIPAGYAAYYTSETATSDVRKVEHTWWYQLMGEIDSNLLLNCSWSGTTVCHTGWHGVDIKDHSFIGRFDKLVNDGFFEKNNIDTLFIFGSTNDSWADSPLGEPMFEGWTESDLYNVLPAIAYLVNRARQTLPDARILCVLNTELKPEINKCFIDSCQKFGVELIRLSDIHKENGHPTIKGMKQIKEQIKDFLSADII